MTTRKRFLGQCALGVGSVLFLPPFLKDLKLPKVAPPMPRSEVYTGVWDKDRNYAAIQIGHYSILRDRPFDVKAWEARWNVAPEHYDWFWYHRNNALEQKDPFRKYLLFQPEIQTSDMPAWMIFVWGPKL